MGPTMADSGSEIALDSADQNLEQMGYEPKLERTLKSFTSFAIAFSFISITTGLFTTYGFALTTAGPAGIWMWVVAGVGQMAVALVFAQLAAHIPLSGYSYQWASRLTGPRVGWWFGWLSYAFLAIVIVSVDFAMVTQALVPLFGLSLSSSGAEWVTVGILIVQAILISFSPRIVALLNAGAVATEIVGISAIIVLLIAAVIFGSQGSVSNLFSTGAVSHHGYFSLNGPFMLAVLLGAYTIVGFESASNLAEETENPTKVVPRAMWRATAISGFMGLLFLIALDVAIPNVSAVTASSAPVSLIMREQLGHGIETVILVIVTISIFACGLVIMTSGSRLVYAMSRDRRFPAHQLFGRVTRMKTPMWATVLVMGVGIVIMLLIGGDPSTLANLFTASAIMPSLIYFATVIMYVTTRKKLPRRAGSFNLGRWEWPMIAVSLLWLVFVLIALLFPSSFWAPVKLVGLLLLIGLVSFVGFLVFDRKVFAKQPVGAFIEGAWTGLEGIEDPIGTLEGRPRSPK
jgi:amino acid transporter